MDLRQAVHIWRARWRLTSVLLILALVGAAGAGAETPRYYQSTSSVVLLASPAASTPNGGNPFLSFSPSLTLTADAVSRELMSPGTVGQLAARGFTAPYTVVLPSYTTSTTGSVLLVTVTGSDAAGVQRTLEAVTARIGTQLAQLQQGVPAHGQVHADTLSFTPQAMLSISQTARPLVVVGVLLLVLSLGTPIVVDGLVTRRRLRDRSALPDYSALSTDWALLISRPSLPGRRSRRSRRSRGSWPSQEEPQGVPISSTPTTIRPRASRGCPRPHLPGTRPSPRPAAARALVSMPPPRSRAAGRTGRPRWRRTARRTTRSTRR